MTTHETSLRARPATFEFGPVDGPWLPASPWIAFMLDGASIALPHLEPYLIRVMRQARPRVEQRAPELLGDVDVFNRQEANHYRAHAAYNARLLERFPELEAFDREIRDDFASFLEDRSLEWNLAYCEGFESLGLVSSELLLQGMDEWLTDAEPAVTELWQWHLAEEFEHRGVAHDVLAALAPGYARRVKGFVTCARHLFGFTGRVASMLASGDPNADAAVQRTRSLHRHAGSFMARGVARILMPGYTPHARTMQPPTRRTLARYEA